MNPTADRYEAAPDRAVDLRTLAGAPLPVIVRELRVDTAAGVVADAALELDGAAYGRCLDEGLFGLDAPGRSLGPEPALDRPVRLAVRLRAHLADRLGDGEDPMAALIERLFAPGGAVAHAEAWRALDVTQHDDALGGAVGYRTAWGVAVAEGAG